MRLHRYHDPICKRVWVLLTDAQPVEHIVPEMLDDIMAGRAEPYARATGEQLDVLNFCDDYGHHYVYRLADFDVSQDAFRMELDPDAQHPRPDPLDPRRPR